MNLYLQCSFAITSKEVLDSIRIYLHDLIDSQIGAIDSEGNYLKNGQGLNCSGFAKWIVDGFYTPLCKDDEPKYISIQVLRRKHLEERGTPDVLIYEDSRDPYFGLDWTRNLAVELGKKRGEKPVYKTYDITDSTVCDYVMNCGYPLWKIERVLIEQELLHPGRIYLGSINGYYGNNPKLWQHYHIAVFIPYYENNILKIIVLERNKETSFGYLLQRYPNTYCHLVGFTTEGEYELMEP
ncbi:hypothetical protein [Treponema sp.]|uniref:hypothetical protein n=1 Tax=Treponema sp. TaxID=166 RepID=UPI00298E321A|nr:hypothetical protein [Treponema sp.]